MSDLPAVAILHDGGLQRGMRSGHGTVFRQDIRIFMEGMCRGLQRCKCGYAGQFREDNAFADPAFCAWHDWFHAFADSAAVAEGSGEFSGGDQPWKGSAAQISDRLWYEDSGGSGMSGFFFLSAV